MGLLDDFGSFIKTPEGQGLLSAAFGGMAGAMRGAPINTIGRAGVSGLLGYTNATQQDLNQKKENLQMDMLKQQVAQATRKNGLINDMLQQYTGGGAPAATGGAPAAAALTQGAAVGDIGPTVTNAARIPAAAPVAGLLGKVPREAISHDLAFNDGKNIAEWLYKQGTPDMQVSNGYAYDRNDVKPGFMPSINVSQNGQATVTGVDPKGAPVVYAPPGALETYRAYQNAGKEADARYTPLDPDKYVPKDGSPPKRTVLDYVAPELFPSIPPAVQQQRDVQAIEAAKWDIANARTPEQKAQAEQALNTMVARQRAGQSVITGAATSGDVMTPAEKEQVVGRVKADNAVREARLKDAQSPENIQKVNDARMVIDLLDRAEPLLSKASSGMVGAGMTSVASGLGISTDAAKANAQLRVLEGSLVAKMPKMSGPQSDKDVALYKQMAGVIGDPTTPADQKRAAAQVLRSINEKYLAENTNLNGVLKPTMPSMDGGPPPRQEAAKPTSLLSELPKANPSNQGKMAIDHQTGKRFRSNGLQWVEVK